MHSAPSARRKRFSSLRKRVWATRELYIALVPALVFYAIFKYWPIYGMQIAFRNYSPWLGMARSPWVGMRNFNRFFASADCMRIIGNTIRISLLQLAIGMPFSILLALMLNMLRSQRLKKVVQTVTYAPHFISTVVLVGIVLTVLSPYSGVVNIVIKRLGGSPIYFMAKSRYFLPIYIISGIWQETGWGAVIYMAALASVNPELHEAAIVDGASRLRRVWHIDLPCILPTIVTMLILRSGQVMTVGHEKILLLQNAINSDVSEVISTYTYKKGLINGDFGYSTAAGLFQSVVNYLLLLVVNRFGRLVNDVSLW